MKVINLKPIINKNNRQINISLPRKKISKVDLKKIDSGSRIKFMIESIDE